VSVPLWGRGRVIGTISADNAFNQRPIETDDVRLLEVFAKHAGLAIEHARVVHGVESSSPEPGRSQDVLVQREKMAALRQMANDVAHAIRNPVVSIGGLARRLDKTLEPKASAKKYTEIMIKETTRLEGILDGITDYSTEEKPLFSMHDLNTIVRDALIQVGEIRKNADIQMAYEPEPNLPEICCDRQKIKQTVLHILLNAADAMNGQGTLHVRTYSAHRNARNWVTAEITDSGGGISQEILQNIFHPFFSTRSKDPGLGLAICHKIVTSHQGSIDMDNRPGEGVRVVITLPQDQR
jgi:signal transduction histidine kinase